MPAKTVFLDRDGVISIFTPDDYIKNWNEFEFIPGAIEGLKILSKHNYRLVIISNQAGVNKGLFTKKSLDGLTKKMLEVLKKQGVEIEKIYYCTHTPEENCACRKPKPGSFYRAQKELGGIDLQKTFFIGDSDTDVQAGKSAGTKTILVLSGKTKSSEETEEWEFKPDHTAKDLKHAVEIIIKTQS
jgi:D,D-heptose 1,7-bisphosphate phosphatase